jgi:hypothetical protein
MTHPNAVSHYKSKGDEAFKTRFDLKEGENSIFLQDGNIREIESKDNQIHVQYEFLGIDEDSYELVSKKIKIYAVSVDNGGTWKFIDHKDYINTEIINSSDRLIK